MCRGHGCDLQGSLWCFCCLLRDQSSMLVTNMAKLARLSWEHAGWAIKLKAIEDGNSVNRIIANFLWTKK